MKKLLQLKTMLLLCALMTGSLSAWADDYTLGWGNATGSDGTYTNFTTTSGTVTDLVSFSTAKNSSSNNPAWNENASELRLYYQSGGNGGSITLTPAAGVTITGAVMTTSTAPSVKYSVNGGTAVAVSVSSNTYTVSGISATTSLTFQNVNTSNTQLRIKTIKITYTKVDVAKHTATFSVNGATSSAEFAEGSDIEFPAVSSVLGMKFMGWTTSAIVGTQNSAPATLLTEATMSTSDITYYAVFAYKDAGKFVLDYGVETALSSSTSWGSYGTAYPYTASDGSEWVVKAYKNAGMQINNSKDCSIKIPTCPSDIKSINITCSAEKAVGLSASDYSGSGTITYIVSGSDATSQTLDFTEKTVKTGYIVPKSGNTSITKVEVIYSNSVVIKDYCTTVPTATITLNGACTDGEKIYGTYSNSSAFIVPGDLTVSEIKVNKGNLSITNYTTGAVVPANTGVMISSTTSGDHTVALTTEAGTSVLGEDNMMKASSVAMTQSDTKFYRLTMHNGTDIGFWWGAADGAAFDIAANKAYLAVPTSALATARQGFSLFGEDEVNGIDNPQLSTLNSQPIYSLSGQRVEKAKKGLYIVNGKKCVIR